MSSSVKGLDQGLQDILLRPEFLDMRGVAKEVPIFTQTYNPADDDELRRVVDGTEQVLRQQGIPAVCVVPTDAPAVFHHESVRFVACPACHSLPSSRKRIQCINCGGRFGLPLCAQADRGFVISFPAHGARAAAAAAHCS